MIELDVIPMGAVRMTKADAWKGSDCVIRYRLYKDTLRNEVQKNNYQLPEILENITFVIPFPKSYSKKKRQSLEGKPHTLKPDLDNLLKAVQDTIADNDSYVHTYNNIRKIWGETGKIIIG